MFFLRINYTPSVPVTHLCTANRRIVLVLANKSVVRVDQAKPDASMEVVDLSKAIGPKAKINQAFLDPRGNHLVLTLKSSGWVSEAFSDIFNAKLSLASLVSLA
jgi:hypothetical protein